MKKTPNQHISERVSPSPSTSNEYIKDEDKHIRTNNRSQIKPLNCKDVSVKFIQVSPMKSLPKQNILNLVRLTAPTEQICQASNIRILKPKKEITVFSDKIVRPFQEILPKSPETLISSSSLPVLSPSNTIAANQVSGNCMSKTNIPSILQKKALLITTQNTTEIGNQSTETDANINNDLPICQETNIIKQKGTIKCKPNETKTASNNKHKDIQIQSKPNASPTVAKNKHKEIKMVKPPSTKNRSPKKRPNDTNKDSKISEDSLYVADGFREDVECLLEKCLQVYKLNFEKFTDIWKDMDFPCIFHGRQSSAELAELSEEVIHIAKTHMLAKNVTFEENVAGLFLVYALLHHQPFSGFASLRLVPSDVPLLLCLEVEARQQKRHDVLYVLASVLIKGPCQFHVEAREVSLEVPIRKYYDGTVQMSRPMDSVFTRNAECVPHFKELVTLEQRYVAMRQRLRNRHNGRDKISDLCKRPAATLYELFRAHIPRGRHSDRSPEELINEILSSSKPEDKRADLLKSIKERAMTNVVDPMRHLTAVDERHQGGTSSSSEDSEIESRPIGRKVRIKGRGRCSATMLQELFGFGETKDETCVPEPALKEMPALDAIDNLSGPYLETTSKRQTDKDKLLDKKELMKLDNDDSKNNNKSASNKRKLKNNIDSPTAKRKAKAKNDLIKIDDLIPAEDRIVSNLDITNELDVEDNFNSDNEASEYVTKKVSNNIPESFNQNVGMPSILIEIENIEMDTFDDCEAVKIPKKEKKGNLSKSKDVSVSKDASNTNIVSKKDIGKDKKNKKAPKIKKADIIPDYNNLKTENSPKKTQSKKYSPGKVPKSKDASVSDNNTVSSKEIGKDKKLKKALKIEKTDIKIPDCKYSKKEDASKKSKTRIPKLEANQSQEISSPEKTKSPLKRTKKTAIDAKKSPKTSSPVQVNTPLTPRTKTESKRIKFQTESPRNVERRSCSKKRKTYM